MTPKLTKKQEETLHFLRERHRASGSAPTYREIAEKFDIDVKAAFQRVSALGKKGVVILSEGRTPIELAPDFRPERGLPVLGQVPAGRPLESEAWVDEYSYIAEDLFGGNVFGLRVRGDSMVDRGILNDDLLIVRQDSEPAIGSVVVGAVDGEFTVKSLRQVKGRLHLCPANESGLYESIAMKADDKLLGRVLWSVREVSR